MTTAQSLKINFGLSKKPTTTYNPQSKGIIEWVHQVIGNSLPVLDISESTNPPTLGDDELWENMLSSVAWAMYSTYHTMLEATPGQLVFGHDMLLPITFRANWVHIHNKKQTLIIQNNQKENCKLQHHVYSVGDLIMLEKPGKIAKLNKPHIDPHEFIQVITNSTVDICRGIIEEMVNIGHMLPY